MSVTRHIAKLFASKLNVVAYCEDLEVPAHDERPVIEEQNKILIKPPIQYENIKTTIQQQSVSTYDGFRLVVQKQANLNTVVSHFYWLGSQQTGQPIYQYRVIMPFEDKVINVATDLDFNIEGEVKWPVNKDLSLKTNFATGDQANNLSFSIDHTDDDSASQIEIAQSNSNSLTFSRMQSITPNLSLGGLGRYMFDKGILDTAYGGVYDDEKNLVALEWDSAFKMMYLRRINPNRVHLSSEMVVDENDRKVAINAEYILKQSKLHIGIDSTLLVKSSVETTMSAGVSIQFCAEMNQSKDYYRFGYGIMMG